MAGGPAPVAGWFSNQWRTPREIFMKKKASGWVGLLPAPHLAGDFTSTVKKA